MVFLWEGMPELLDPIDKIVKMEMVGKLTFSENGRPLNQVDVLMENQIYITSC